MPLYFGAAATTVDPVCVRLTSGRMNDDLEGKADDLGEKVVMREFMMGMRLAVQHFGISFATFARSPARLAILSDGEALIPCCRSPAASSHGALAHTTSARPTSLHAGRKSKLSSIGRKPAAKARRRMERRSPDRL
jgi:hypothetical protein